jgi:hypothetical protein
MLKVIEKINEEIKLKKILLFYLKNQQKSNFHCLLKKKNVFHLMLVYYIK